MAPLLPTSVGGMSFDEGALPQRGVPIMLRRLTKFKSMVGLSYARQQVWETLECPLAFGNASRAPQYQEPCASACCFHTRHELTLQDFELAFWQLTYLVVAPRRVYKQTYHQYVDGVLPWLLKLPD